jgi:3-oxoacyl-[acyl-carrier-protein] synthase II
MKPTRVAITGLGCICAAGSSLEQTMRSLYAGRRCPTTSRRLRLELSQDYPVFEISVGLDDLYETRLQHEPTRTTRLALIAAEQALRQAGIDRSILSGRRVGVCLGTTVGCTLNDEQYYRAFRAGEPTDVRPLRRYLANNPAEFLSEGFGLRGPVATVANACSSGTDAVGLARAWLAADECDIAIAGGCDELARIPCLGFAQLLIASPEPCRPFDRNRRGLNLGEGAGIVVLEREASVSRRGVSVLAFIAGYASHADAYHPTAPDPEGVGLRRAMRAALREAELEPDQVGFVSAHGTATVDNDRVEGRAVREVLSDEVPIVATKAYTGHTLGAAGGLQAVLTVQALLDQRLPATAGFAEPDPDVACVPTTANLSLRAEAAISNSLAFGGNNSVLVFRR